MSSHEKRKIEILVLSDIHLGTYGCKAKELHNYMKSITPETVILNGDILDIWQFNKRYWPKFHMKIIKQIMDWVSQGIKVNYITGNHDELLRKFEGFELGTFSIKNKMVLNLNNEKAWFFHGDVFDITMQHSKWLAKLGSKGYDLLIHINSFVNFISIALGKGHVSLSKKIKNKVKGAVKYVNNFEKIVTDIAIENGYNYVVCGHIHQPELKEYKNNKGSVIYLNSGDWIENMTALEYNNNKWEIYSYNESDFADIDSENKIDNEATDIIEKSHKQLFNEMLATFVI